VEVLDVPGMGTLNVTVQHKNLEDTSWTNLVAFSGITTTGAKTATGTAIKEQLRFVYSITGGGGPNVYDTYYVNVLAPVWTPWAPTRRRAGREATP
jgi:hypothetical protein